MLKGVTIILILFLFFKSLSCGDEKPVKGNFIAEGIETKYRGYITFGLFNDSARFTEYEHISVADLDKYRIAGAAWIEGYIDCGYVWIDIYRIENGEEREYDRYDWTVSNDYNALYFSVPVTAPGKYKVTVRREDQLGKPGQLLAHGYLTVRE